MGTAKYDVLEMRCVIEPELSRLYVRCGPDSDGGFLVGGWYTKTLPPSSPALDFLVEAMRKQDYLLWDRGTPKERKS